MANYLEAACQRDVLPLPKLRAKFVTGKASSQQEGEEGEGGRMPMSTPAGAAGVPPASSSSEHCLALQQRSRLLLAVETSDAISNVRQQLSQVNQSRAESTNHTHIHNSPFHPFSLCCPSFVNMWSRMDHKLAFYSMGTLWRLDWMLAITMIIRSWRNPFGYLSHLFMCISPQCPFSLRPQRTSTSLAASPTPFWPFGRHNNC
jgi:hypothetical protein